MATPEPLHYGIVTLLDVQPAWLALDRGQRDELSASLNAIIAAAPEVDIRFFDADALGHGYTDFIFAETSDLRAYHFMWERIKDTPLFTVPYFAIKDVVFGIEEGYRAYAQAEATHDHA